MNCPSCNRILASTLSLCPTCGTMVHDSVREELSLKVSPAPQREKPIFKAATGSPISPSSVVFKNQGTSPIMTKTTSATLVDFQNKNPNIPEWRLQVQNAVRKRLGNQNPAVKSGVSRLHRATQPTEDAAISKTEVAEQFEPVLHTNKLVANALRRIEESKQKYLIVEDCPPPIQKTSVRQFPQIVPNHIADEVVPKQEFTDNVVLFSEDVIKKGVVTNKLPPLPPAAKISSSFEKRHSDDAMPESRKIDIADVELDYIYLPASNKSNHSDVVAYSEAEDLESTEETEEIEDFAPLSMRFNAALFDLLICSFLSLFLLSPFMLLNGKFFSMEGFFAFIATCAIVTFIYMTAAIGFLGKTFGMRLFSLEIIDVEENAYPTLHQAAVSSSVFLLSLGLGGIGFLAMLLNSERRAAHDLLSGTIVVREY